MTGLSAPRLAPGTALPLVRRLDALPSPAAVFGALAADEAILLESADDSAGSGGTSLVVVRSALRLLVRGRRATVTALTAGGRAGLPALGRALGALAIVDSIEVDAGELTLRLAARSAPETDRERLRAPSSLDLVRALARTFVPTQRPVADPLLVAGVFGYELADRLEGVAPEDPEEDGFPDVAFWLPEELLRIDHRRRTTLAQVLVLGGEDDEDPAAAAGRYHDADRALARLVAGCESARDAALDEAAAAEGAVSVDLDDAAFAERVVRLKREVTAGEVFQVVPSRTFRGPCADPLAAYRRLLASNPSPYMFLVRAADWTLLGASPETCVKVERGTMTVKPIAGTRPRGRDAELDARLEAELRLDRKELSEHLMLVDLARNDVARVCAPGTRRVARLLSVERYRHVMHLVSTVEGELPEDLDALAAYAAAANCGTLVGAPKRRAAELIREVEATPRGPYGGAVGYLTGDGEMDTAIVIRAALVRDGEASVRAGAGVVHDSDPVAEADETRRKARSALDACVGRTRPAATVGAEREAARVLLVDNHDSFAFNLADELARRGAEVQVVRNTLSAEAVLARAAALAPPRLLLLSPGPGTPEAAGCCVPLIRRLVEAGDGPPMLGVCLGLQALVVACGGEVGSAGEVVHGRAAKVVHDGRGLFAGLPASLTAARYHSLAALSLPAELERAAWLDDGELTMAARHARAPLAGLQFHPESILTPRGGDLLDAALAWAAREDGGER